MGYTPHVLVVGGDPVGAGITRDLAVRGLDVTLTTPGAVAGETTGRMSPLLASGAAVAGEDPELAGNCLAEHRTLSTVAAHCVDGRAGLLVPADESECERLQAACADCGIETEELTGDQAREREPSLAPDVERALVVPDTALDPYQLTLATLRDAREYDAEVRPQTTVTDIGVEDGAVTDVTLERDPLPSTVDAGTEADDESGDEVRSDGGSTEKQVPGTTGRARGEAAKRLAGTFDTEDETGTATRPETTAETLDVDYVVNAAGERAGSVVDLAGLSLPVETEHETAVLGAERVVGAPVLGAAGSRAIPFGEQTVLEGDVRAANGGLAPGRRPDEVDRVRTVVGETVPAAGEERAVRSVARTRHAVPDQVPGGHRFALVDHGDQQGCWGLLTVLGGSPTTHRLVAERVTDVVCGEFGIGRACQTRDIVLPGSEDVPDLAEAVGTFGLAESVYERSKRRLGSRASLVLHSEDANPVLCESRAVCRAEVREALAEPVVVGTDLNAVRAHTSATMGEYQGGRCAHRLAAELYADYDRSTVEGALTDLLDDRWRGQRGVVGGEHLAEMARNYRLHAATMHRKRPPTGVETGRFDDGRGSDDDSGPHCCPRASGEPFAGSELLADRLEVSE